MHIYYRRKTRKKFVKVLDFYGKTCYNKNNDSVDERPEHSGLSFVYEAVQNRKGSDANERRFPQEAGLLAYEIKKIRRHRAAYL